MNDGVAHARIALLNDAGAAAPHVRAALESLGARIVFEAACAPFDRAALDASGADVVIVNLGTAGDDIDHIYELLDDGRYRVIFNEADVSGGLSGWDQTRWARHLAAKIAGGDDIDPPRPNDAEAVPDVRTDAHATAATLAGGVAATERPMSNERSGTTAADDAAVHSEYDGDAEASGIDELLRNFDAAIGAAERRDRDAHTPADIADTGETAAANAAIDADADAVSDADATAKARMRPPASGNAAAARPSPALTLALADDDAPIAQPAKPATETSVPPPSRLSEQWSLQSLDDAPPKSAIGGKAAYTARDVASASERLASSTPPAATAVVNESLSPAESWLSSLQLEPIHDEAEPRAQTQDDTATADADATVVGVAPDQACLGALRRVWMLAASGHAGQAIGDFLDGLTPPPAALVVVVGSQESGTPDSSAASAPATPLTPREPADGERVGTGDVIIVPADALLHVDAQGRVTITPADDSFPYRSPLDRMLCDAADVFGAALSAVMLDGAPGDALQACRHVVERGGVVYAQDAADCSKPATLEALAASGIARAIASPRQLAAMLATAG